MNQAVTCTVDFTLLGEGSSYACTTELRYTADEPLSVTLRFPTHVSQDGTPVQWVFARDLLAGGLHGPSGEGDVRIHPLGSRHTGMELRAPGGTAVLTVRTAPLRVFLERSFAVVAQGAERPQHDWDGFAARLADVDKDADRPEPR